MQFVEKAEKALKNRKVGGFSNYVNYAYYCRNTWILTTLWLALHYIKAGQQGSVKSAFAE